jgi:hypothetical protein
MLPFFLMEKERDDINISEEDRSFLNSAITSLDHAEKKLEESFNKNNPNQFNSIKKFMSKLNKKVSETI